MRNQELWTALDADREQYPFLFGEPCTAAEVAEAERELGVRFDPVYAEFVRRYGGAIVGAERVHGLCGFEEMGTGPCTVVEVTRKALRDGYPLPSGGYVVCIDGGGDLIVVDGEGQVWLVDHATAEVLPWASSFLELLARLVRR
jgi:hypothetical protein